MCWIFSKYIGGKMKKRILFGITSLTIGGAERVLIDLANSLSEKYDITIFTIYSKGEMEKQLSPGIKIKSLYKKNFREYGFLKRLWISIKILLLKDYIYLKKIKGDYDIEIAFLEGPITRLFSCNNKKIKKIAWIHNDITQVFGKGTKSKIKRFIDKKVYSGYDTIVFVSNDNLKQFCNTYKINKTKVVIRNYINSNSIIQKSKLEKNVVNKEDLNFVSVSRLVKQKRIDRLIHVHKRLIEEGRIHHIYVIGDGPEKSYLKQLIDDNKLNNTFHLLGKKENPYPYFQNTKDMEW